MSTKLRILIVGGTSLIAECCARLWMEKNNCELILFGRDEAKLNRIASDLNIRHPNSGVTYEVLDFLNEIDIQRSIQKVYEQGVIDIALIAHGWLPPQKDLQENLKLCKYSIEINGISPILFAEAIVGIMLKKNFGKLVVIGSVAGDRGRKSN